MDITVSSILTFATNIAFNIASKFQYLFYVVNPYDCMYKDVRDVPRYVEEMFPVFIVLALLENGLRLLQGKSILRANDTIASLSQGIFQECVRLKIRSFEVLIYTYVWNNYRLITLPWDSQWTWWLCFLGVDLGFYIFHRCSHEINVMWSVHQAHHSAEDFTMLSSLRQAILQPFTAWFAYQPLALFVPPSIFLTHLQLSELYMIWIHTEVVQTLGPLELILNTPSHHRVHHGRNRKYIDKNYGGTLIIWDRMFGTFEREDVNEPVVYGLVHPVNSYNPFYVQFHLLFNLIHKLFFTEGWKNKLNVVCKGPGWAPGKSRLGDINDVPLLTQPIEYWSPVIPIWQTIYSIWHFAMVLIFYHLLTANHQIISQFMVTYCILALIISISCIGFLIENRWFAWFAELVRCSAFLICHQSLLSLVNAIPLGLHHVLYNTLYYSFVVSIALCIVIIFVKLTSGVCVSYAWNKYRKNIRM